MSIRLIALLTLLAPMPALAQEEPPPVEVEIVGVRAIGACSLAVLSKIRLQNTLWLRFLINGAHFAVVFRRCVV